MHPNNYSPRMPDRSRDGPRSEDCGQSHAGARKQILLNTADSALYLGPRPPPAAINPLRPPENDIVFALHPAAPVTFFQPETNRTLTRIFRMLRVGLLRVFRERPAVQLRLRFRFPFSLHWLRFPALPSFLLFPSRTTRARLFSPGPRPRSLLRDLHAAHVINVFRGRSLFRRFRGLPPRSTGSCER